MALKDPQAMIAAVQSSKRPTSHIMSTGHEHWQRCFCLFDLLM
jgi:hypothetical protein